MSLKDLLKHILPMSSRSLNGRLDNIMARLDDAKTPKQMKDLESRLSAIEKRLNKLEKIGTRLEKLEYNHLDPDLYAHAISQWYTDSTGEILHLDDPKTYNEKIQWMKLYDRDPLKSVLADKLQVREWVKEKIGEEYLIPLLAVYHRAEQIDFSALPNAFVLKTNHGSGMNAIVRDKAAENLPALRSKARSWLQTNFTFHYGYELQYNTIPRRLIIEEYIENSDGDLPDYKFFCFDGKCRFIEYIANRKNGGEVAMYDPEWHREPFNCASYKAIKIDVPKPEALPKMLNIAEKLAESFPHVRVDLYLLDNGEIKFGEMTFTPASGAFPWTPPEADLLVGEMFHLPESVQAGNSPE